MPKATKVKSVTIRTHPVQNPTGLILADKTPVNVGMVMDGALLIDPIWFRKHKDALLKAEGKIILQLDLLVQKVKQLPTANKDIIFEVMAPHVPELRIVEPARLPQDPPTEEEIANVVSQLEPDLKIVKEFEDDKS